MNDNVMINLSIEDKEVPLLRESVGWARRDQDYPLLFERCTFWAGMRGKHGELIAFGYLCGMGLEHGYIEDVIVHPAYQGLGIGAKLVKRLLVEAETVGIEVVTVTFDTKHASFYQRCGFTCGGEGFGEKEIGKARRNDMNKKRLIFVLWLVLFPLVTTVCLTLYRFFRGFEIGIEQMIPHFLAFVVTGAVARFIWYQSETIHQKGK